MKEIPQSLLNFNAIETTEDLKFIRSKFAAFELGIREKLIIIVFGQSSLSVALNASVGKHVPRMHFFIEQSRIDADMTALAENLTPYRTNGQHTHVHVLNAILNKSLHENYDWFLFVPDTTFVNPFQLLEFIKHKSSDESVVFGIPGGKDRCLLEAGILVSNPVVRSLVQQRHVCASIVANSDDVAFANCIARATNISCQKNKKYVWWKTEENSDGTSAIHDRIQSFSKCSRFNRSLTVSKLLSDTDVKVLHKYFIRIEKNRLSKKIDKLTKQFDGLTGNLSQSQSWPKHLPPVVTPPNRYQINYWEYFTETNIFKIELNQNSHPLAGNDVLDIGEAVDVAKNLIKSKRPGLNFVRLRNGYRSFNPTRGMEYILDLEFYNDFDEIESKRVILCRPIERTQLVPHVPYVKEDTDITLVIPVRNIHDVIPIRAFLVRHLRMCKSSISQIDHRRMKLVIAVRGINAINIRRISTDLNVLRQSCKSMQIETGILLLKPGNDLPVEMAAMDEAIDNYGQQVVYALLSPHADYQKEFLDRIRINSIRHFQVFMPIPFAEFSPKLTYADKMITEKGYDTQYDYELEKRMEKLNTENVPSTDTMNPVRIHKTQGIFDSKDFSTIAMYGADYVTSRHRLLKQINRGETINDLSSLFLGQTDIHILRAVEPSLKIRYHTRTCPTTLKKSDLFRCKMSQTRTIGSKSQLANVVFNDLEDLSVFH
uniref:Hexosyltransferase n=1 Tax=Panagrolaimus sp. JU765 TaxID=591449 RepID=A0AC34PV22_9BILA